MDYFLLTSIFRQAAHFGKANFSELRKAEVELPRIPLPRTWVNKDELGIIVGRNRGERVHQVVADDGRQQRKPDFGTIVEDVKAVAMILAMEAESILGRRLARFLGVLALFAVVVGTLLFLVDLYINPARAGERKDLILTVAQILGGTALLSGLYFTWRTLQVNREGQITDRFTRAIDQLGRTDDKGMPCTLEHIIRCTGHSCLG
jgi:hypothetical protein